MSPEFIISRNNKLGELSFLGRQFIISFELYLDYIVHQDPCTSVIHFTIGGDHKNYGHRTPAVFSCKNGLVVVSAIDGKNVHSRKEILEEGRWYKFFLSQLLIENQVTKSCLNFCSKTALTPP